MALTIALVDSSEPGDVWGQKRAVFATVTFDSSYPTDGEAFDALAKAALGLTEIFAVVPCGGAINVRYVKSAGKLKAFWVDTTTDGAVMAEVVNTTDLSAQVITCLVIGR